MSKTYKTLKDFYPYYLEEHQQTYTRVLHFIGTLLMIVLFVYVMISMRYLLLLLLPVIGYGFAWVSHYLFEKNKPATFRHPLYSLASDFILFWHLLIGKEKF